MKRYRPVMAGMVALLVGGCTVGPDYAGPPKIVPPAANQFHNEGVETQAAGPVQARWWQTLHDPLLDDLVAQALAANPSVAQAQARLRQSRSALNEKRADLLPSADTSALFLHAYSGGSGVGGSTGGGSPDLNFYDAGFDATWEVDLFGGQRRAVESARAEMVARRADLAATQVTLTADVAQAFIDLRDAQNRMALIRRSIDIQGRMIGLAQAREGGGTASALDVLRLVTLLDQTKANLAPLQTQEQAQLSRLAILTGQIPGVLDRVLATPQPVPLPPDRVAIADPAAMIRRRPDIQAAERDIAADTAQIGVRTADLFPKLELLGNIGFGSADIGQLLSSAAFTGIAAPILQWKPFDFGRTRAKIGQAKAARDEAIGHYREVVLAALDDAETALARYGREREQVLVLAHEDQAAERAAALTHLRFDGGTATMIDVLDTERQRLEAEQALAQGKADVTRDFIGLQKSLGLGWGQN